MSFSYNDIIVAKLLFIKRHFYMTTLIDKILAILNGMTSIKTVVYGSGFDANVRLDRKETPAAVVYLAQEMQINISSGIRRDSVNVEIFFCNRTPIDIKGEDLNTMLKTSIEPLVFDFLYLLNSDKSVVIDEDTVVARLAYGKFDCNVAGLSLELKISEKQGRCF